MAAVSPLIVREAAVLGAGVMGAQIAAHLVNAGVPTRLYELPAKTGDPNADAAKAIERLNQIEPPPLALPARAAHIRPANYDEHLAALAECDLVIEAIAERLDWKIELYGRIAPHVRADAVLATNTSGLSIDRLAQALPAALRQRFCGVHFFNPPRYMHLVELIPGTATDARLLDAVEAFLVTTLGKGVVRAKDTPNFIGNRVGVFSLLAVIHHAERLGLGFDTVDALTGPLIGRPKSATFRTADVVGLDTFAHVVQTMREGLSGDPWHRYYALPDWLAQLIAEGALGQKARRGVYRKVGTEIQVLDLRDGKYRPAQGAVDEGVAKIMREPDVPSRYACLRGNAHPHAQFLWAVHRDTFHYCAAHLAEIAHSARDVDLALRWGFGWSQGPFETWQAAGWRDVAQWIQQDVAAGRAMTAVPLPAWATDVQRPGVHRPQGSYSPRDDTYRPRSSLPVYRRQPFPDRLVGEAATYGDTVFETDAVRCWHMGDGIAILSFKTKLHTIGEAVLDGIRRAVEEAERRFQALVIWQTEPPFSAGADLKGGRGGGSGQPSSSVLSKAGEVAGRLKREAAPLVIKAAHRLGIAERVMAGALQGIEGLVRRFQETNLRLRYAAVPIVAAVDGLALGGGCELAMHCARTVATLESYPGLVEAGVGLIPAGGGCKELVLRAAAAARGGDVFPEVQRCFRTVALAEVARSAAHAQALGYLRPEDTIVMNRYELLHVAKSAAVALVEAAYRPPLPATRIPVAGRDGIAILQAHLVNLLEGGHISQHDYLIAGKLATVLCGGEVDDGSVVDEQWLLDLECEHFMALIATEKTQARIEHMLKTGKPLRN